MIPLEIDIPPHVAQVIRRLPPDVKKSVKEAIRAIAQDPHLGAPLVGNLTGLWKYKVRRFRIVYAPIQKRRVVRIYAVGHRREIYDKLSHF